MGECSKVQAVYSFKGKNNDELCFKKGDVITVTQRDSGGWWEGTLLETTGWFPSNYVRELERFTNTTTNTTDTTDQFRNVVLNDVLDSEKAHAAEIANLLQHFLEPLEGEGILSGDEYRQLIGNLPQVVHAHRALAEAMDGNQRLGGLFLSSAPDLERVHKAYCASHPKAVCVLDKHKEELGAFMERRGAVSPGLLVLTTGLSKPFRHLHKYPAMLQELARHAAESHPDRGDAHRAYDVYRDLSAACAAIRRQKELELQVVTGAVRGWRSSQDLTALGEVLHMGGVALGDSHADRYLVLFPNALLILSVSKRMSAFVYEGCLPLTGISISKLQDTDKRKNAFQISGSLIDSIVAVCQSASEADKWVDLLRSHTADACNQDSSSTAALKTSPTETLLSNAATPQGLANHKRSHSFNNHRSYVQHQKQRDYHRQDKNDWIQSSCDALLGRADSPLPSSRSTAASFVPQATAEDSSREGWSVRSLRPAPPLRPSGDSEHETRLRRKRVNSYEEDALVLRVIEAYCSSARSRHALNSESQESLSVRSDWLVRSPSLPLHYPPARLLPKLSRLEADVDYLKGELLRLSARLDKR